MSLLAVDILVTFFPRLLSSTEVYILLMILSGLPHIYGYVGHGK